jgi:hypothetical protein
MGERALIGTARERVDCIACRRRSDEPDSTKHRCAIEVSAGA